MNIGKQSHIWKFIKVWGNSNEVYRFEHRYGEGDLCSFVKLFSSALLKCMLIFTIFILIGSSTIYHTVGCIIYDINFLREPTIYINGSSFWYFLVYAYAFCAIVGYVSIIIGICICFVGIISEIMDYIARKRVKIKGGRNKGIQSPKQPNLIVEAVKGYIGKYCAIIKIVD